LILFICGSDQVEADIPVGQKTEKLKKGKSTLCETTCPGSPRTPLRGAQKGSRILE